MDILKIALICGGPSAERGISLNSARTVLDHLQKSCVEIYPIYVDYRCHFYRIAPAQLYSNTPADFDFKLHQMGEQLEQAALIQFLKGIDIVFPVIHGAFGDDGKLQLLLEDHGIPYIGSDSASCQNMYPKHKAQAILKQNGFATLPSLVLSRDEIALQGKSALQKFVEDFFSHTPKRAIVKPTCGGSSIGVASVTSPLQALEHIEHLFSSNAHSHVILEPFCEGIEFTVVVFENKEGKPVALMPTEIETSYSENEILDYRKKYLATNSASYHTPARFSLSLIEDIRKGAENLFELFKMKDFVRIDGWVLKDGTKLYTDFNPISGLEQNSFFFRQAAAIGFTHKEALEYLIENRCRKYGKKVQLHVEQNDQNKPKQLVHVIFGGTCAERQVSLMSGSNVYLKLLHSQAFEPIPFLYGQQDTIWQLPLSLVLNHTVEEIEANCRMDDAFFDKTATLAHGIQKRLSIPCQEFERPKSMSIAEFLTLSKSQNAFVFIGMHGGVGEDGTLQNLLVEYEIPFNGSSAETSSLCMDKFLTAKVINKSSHPHIYGLQKFSFCPDEIKHFSTHDYEILWDRVCMQLKTSNLIIKPRNDGCSAGIVSLKSASDLAKYCAFIFAQVKTVPKLSFEAQESQVEMCLDTKAHYLLEPFIETDRIAINHNTLLHEHIHGWVELTVGVLEMEGRYHALSPSITVAEGAVLSLEEKFQGGTGINITPPPEEIITKCGQNKIKHYIEETAAMLGIENYARIDIFFNEKEDKMIVIEANTLPGLTPSTVIYHQALAEEQSLPPLQFLEHLIHQSLAQKMLLNTV